MPRTVVVLERRALSRLLGREHQTEAIIRRLAERFRFLPHTSERLGEDFVQIPFPRRKPINEARAEVRDVLDRLNPRWRRHLTMINEPPPRS